MLAEVPGGAIEYRFTPAEPTGLGWPPLVFLHEGLGCVELWRSFPDAVRAATGCPATFVYSRHGYGRSSVVATARTERYMHHEALAVLPALRTKFDLARPILVGHSDGASIALLHAAGGHAVAGLVLLAPHVFVEDRTIAGIEAAKRAYDTTELRARLGRYHQDPGATFWGWNDVWLSPGFRHWNIEEELPSVDVPVLLVQGTRDEYGTMAQLDAIESRVAGEVQRVEIPDAGHSPHLDAPELTLKAVSDFITRVRATNVGQER